MFPKKVCDDNDDDPICSVPTGKYDVPIYAMTRLHDIVTFDLELPSSRKASQRETLVVLTSRVTL